MKIRKGTNLTKYGFEQWSNGVWYLPLETLETNAVENEVSLIVEDNELRLYEHTAKNNEFESVFEIPSALIRMIRDGVVE